MRLLERGALLKAVNGLGKRQVRQREWVVRGLRCSLLHLLRMRKI